MLWHNRTKNIRNTTPVPIIIPIYFNGYLPTNASIITIEKINAVVEKLAGKISPSVMKTGTKVPITMLLT